MLWLRAQLSFLKTVEVIWNDWSVTEIQSYLFYIAVQFRLWHTWRVFHHILSYLVEKNDTNQLFFMCILLEKPNFSRCRDPNITKYMHLK